jgi:metal-sulfur cluster biosynthetic enzyme
MTATIQLPLHYNAQSILDRLDKVLDPELDESVLKLGFIEAIEANDGELTVMAHLPTFWCAPNFAYLMAQDIRRELLAVEGVRQVTVRLKDQVASAAIEAGVNSGQSFSEAFAGEAAGDLGELRGLFLRKGYIKRQEALLRRLKEAGLSFADICALRIQDVHCRDGDAWVQPEGGPALHLDPDLPLPAYLDRRAEIGLDCAPSAPLFLDLAGQPLTAARLEQYLVYARTVRVSLEANGSLCSALLVERKRMQGSKVTR